MGKARFLYNNLITSESMITVSSLRSGVGTQAKKAGAGSATLTPSGAYSGATDKEYILEIDSVAAGKEIGQATFRWSNGGGSWNASAVATSAANILLESGIYVKWVAGAGNDFELGDKWTLKGVNLYNANALIDRDRDHRYRSAALGAPNTITLNLGSAQAFDSLVIYDHNLTSGATIVIEADAAATFDSGGGSSPQVSEAVTWAAAKILHYLAASQTKHYARLKITDAANPAGYIEIGDLFLGPYLQLTRNYVEGFSANIDFVMDANKTKFRVGKDRFYNFQQLFTLNFNRLPAADIALMKAMIAALGNRDTGRLDPFWFNLDSATPADTWLMKIIKLPVKNRTLTYYDMPLEMAEVLDSV
jgi:hypothetical protein